MQELTKDPNLHGFGAGSHTPVSPRTQGPLVGSPASRHEILLARLGVKRPVADWSRAGASRQDRPLTVSGYLVFLLAWPCQACLAATRPR